MNVNFSSGLMLTNHLKVFVFAGFAWAIWRSRNKMAMEQCFPKNPLDVIHSDVGFVQRWRPLLREADQTVIASLGEKMKTWFHKFIPSTVAVSNIGEL